jgi:hypothetical protein
MTWDEHYHLWSELRRQRREEARPQEAHRRMQEICRRVAENTPDDWGWLADALGDAERKWFVAAVFEFQPVPKVLFSAMLRAGVLERNPSFNRQFIEPCVRSFGGRPVLEELLRYLETGSDTEKAGAASAFYWAGIGSAKGEDVAELRRRFGCQMLREFVANEDLHVRRRIIPVLRMDPAAYPEELRPLVPRAIKIARAHPDEYIRHRIEIQLGAGGPFMAIPDA